jgi:hypothetical protein
MRPREAGGFFHALRFILYGTAINILTELTHIGAAGRGFNIAVSQRGGGNGHVAIANAILKFSFLVH